MEGIERIVEDKKRIEWIDILRAFAILAVILCHATEGIYKLNIESVTSMSIMSKFTAFTGFTLQSRNSEFLCVPYDIWIPFAR